jgi:hypothetical protein
MRNIILLAGLICTVLPTIGMSREVLVLLSGRQIPNELRPYSVRRALPLLNAAKLGENVQNSPEVNELLNRLGRYVRVTIEALELDSLRTIPGVVAAWELQSCKVDAAGLE